MCLEWKVSRAMEERGVTMGKSLLHTPDGVRDTYGNECYKKLEVQKRIHRVLQQYGYEDIQTPTFEFFDIFNQERGSVHSNEMYKFFDRDNQTLVLRPDITPSIARCVAKYYEDETMPLRLCYQGNTFLNNSSYQGKLKEVTQVGAELIQDDKYQGDAEMIAMVVDSCLAAGLLEFQIEVGQVEYFKGIMEECCLVQEQQEQIRSFIENKNFLGLENFLEGKKVTEELKQLLLKFEFLYGGEEILEEAKHLTKNKRAIKAIERLIKVHELLKFYGKEHYVSYDLGMLNLYDYYTGITFQGYTYGTGDAIVKGGRYNHLLKQFGKDAPSVGFAFRVDELLFALERQKLEITKIPDVTVILYGEGEIKNAILLAKELRAKQQKVELLAILNQEEEESYISYAKKKRAEKILKVKEDGEIVVI